MKQIVFIFILSLLFNGLVKGQTKNREFRSTWVITWEYATTSGSVEEKKARIRTILDNHVAANMTSVIWQVRQAGTVYYPSSYEPWGSYFGNTNPGFDPLAYAIEESHKRGLDLHAWFKHGLMFSLVQVHFRVHQRRIIRSGCAEIIREHQ